MASGLFHFTTLLFNPKSASLLSAGSYQKFITRQIVSPVVYNFGIHKVAAGAAQARKMILCYHGVVEKPNFSVNNRHMSLRQFDEDMIYLKNRFRIVSMSEMAVLSKENRKVEKDTIVLTFDDGYENNFQNIAPILEKHKIPATFYIITESFENEEFMVWCDLVDFAKAAVVEDLIFDDKIFKRSNSYINPDTQISITDYIKKLGSEREAALEAFEKRYRTQIAPFVKMRSLWKLMSKDQVKTLSQNPLFEIGSHTQKHYCLGKIDAALVKKELTESKSALENLLQKEVKSIAFPDGSYNETAKKIALEAGYENLLGVRLNQTGDFSEGVFFPRWPVSNSTTHQSNMIRLAMDWKKFAF